MNFQTGSLLRGVLILSAILGCSCEDSALPNSSTLHRGLNIDPESLHPHYFSSTQASTVIHDLGEGLVVLGPSGEIESGVAESWEFSDSFEEMHFKLRREAKWSNGDPVVAGDFVRSFRRLVDPKSASPNAEMLSPVENADAVISGELSPSSLGVEAPDERTLIIRLNAPTPHFIQLLIHPSTFPIYIRDNAPPDDNARNSEQLEIRNGAYALFSRSIGSSITLTRNRNYWDNVNTKIDKVIYHVVSEAAEAKRYRAGELDITENVSPATFEIFKRNRSEELHISPILAVYFLAFNLDHRKFIDNRKLRAALSAAIDREALVTDIIGRGEVAAFGVVPPGTSGYEGVEVQFASVSDDERVEFAQKMYRESGYAEEFGSPIELRYSSSGGHREIGLAIQAMWRETLGVRTHLIEEEFRVFLDNVRHDDSIEMFRLGWRADFNDALSFLKIFESANSSNFMKYSNRYVDSLLARAKEEVNAERRRQLLREVESTVLADHPIIPVYFYVSKHLVSPRVRGWRDNVLDIHYSRSLELVEPAK